MIASIRKVNHGALAASGLALCLTLSCLPFDNSAQAQTASSAPSSGKDTPQPTGSTGATAFQPAGAAMGEAQANSAQNGNAGMQERAKPGFDNKPPKGAKASCARPQGGVDVSGGENIGTAASKDNQTCTGGTRKTATKKAATKK